MDVEQLIKEQKKADKLIGSRMEGDFKISTFERIPMIKCPKCKHCFKGKPVYNEVIESEYQNSLNESKEG